MGCFVVDQAKLFLSTSRVRHPGFLYRPERGGSSAIFRAGHRAPWIMRQQRAASGNLRGLQPASAVPASAFGDRFVPRTKPRFFCPFVWPHPSAVTRIASAVRRSVVLMGIKRSFWRSQHRLTAHTVHNYTFPYDASTFIAYTARTCTIRLPKNYKKGNIISPTSLVYTVT